MCLIKEKIYSEEHLLSINDFHRLKLASIKTNVIKSQKMNQIYTTAVASRGAEKGENTIFSDILYRLSVDFSIYHEIIHDNST